MDKSKIETFILTQNDFGQKIYVSQSDRSKSYIVDDEGNMVQYEPPAAIDALSLENSRSTESVEDAPQMNMMGTLESASDFDDHLMQELDSDLMSNDDSNFIMQHMDIQEPLSKLRQLLEQRLGLSLTDYKCYLQGAQMLEDSKTLVEQCVQGQGLVQVNVQLQPQLKRINILDVLKPAEDYIHPDTKETPTATEKPKAVVQWQVDLSYKKEQDRLKIPHDPEEWSAMHVRHWLQWAVRQFNLPNIKLSDWSITGKELYKITLSDFQKIVPSDPGDIFWTHIELLRKMKVVAVKKDEITATTVAVKSEPQVMKHKKAVSRVLNNYTSSVSYFDGAGTSSGARPTTGNGPIQLWQFLLELLTSKEHKNIIQWTGREGEFKLCDPQMVAQLWGERKNKPAMNYEKLSRALRYYYDGDMISKVHGERFVYKFVCDLKELLGYSGIELGNLVKYGNPSPPTDKYPTIFD